MTKKEILALVVLLAIFSSAYAQSNIDEMTVIVANLDKDISEITYTLVLLNSGEDVIVLDLIDKPEGVNVYYKDNFENLKYELNNSHLKIKVDFGKYKQRVVVVKCFFSNLIKIKNGERILAVKQPLPQNISNFEIIVNLPKGAILSDVENSSLIFPEPTNILSDGKRIILNWQVDYPRDNFEIFVDYRMLSLQVNYPIQIVISALIISAGFVVFLIKIYNKKVNRIIAIGLSHEEKKIYDFIKEKGEIKQKILLKEFDFSKPKLSKLIRTLEEKNLIEKKPRGRTNILKLKKI